jgi:hypothetical protein
MSPRDAGHGQDSDDDARVSIDSGRRGQRLICEGWFASHADSGTPGPHVHLRTSDAGAAVVRTDQVPDLIAALTTVAARIDRQWVSEGDHYAAEVVLRAPDPQDPEVAEEQRRRRLRFTQAVHENLTDVMRLVKEATSTDEALVNVAALLDLDEAEVMVGLARFDLLALTRPATERRINVLSEPLD